jgi:TldD protein
VRHRMLVGVVLLLGCAWALGQTPDPVMGTLSGELQRSFRELKKQKVAPYFIAYELTDNHAVNVSSSFGALANSSESDSRLLDIDLRVGDYALDNTHRLKDSDFTMTKFGQFHGSVPLDNDPQALSVGLWLETDRHFKEAVQRFEAVRTNGHIQTPKADDDKSGDYSKAPSEKYSEAIGELKFDRADWERKVRDYGAPFKGNPDITQASVDATGEIETRRYVNTDGSEIRMSSPLYRISIQAAIRTEDGEILPTYKNYMAVTPEGLPSDAEVKQAVADMVKLLVAMRKAPVGDAFTGPAILSGRASAVFFHEIFGHRIEGDRLKDDDDAQTFKKRIGQPILPTFLSVYSDPTLRSFKDQDLVGFYGYDDEGVKARKVSIVEKGIFKTFLMSRSPMDNFPDSNGHGRRQQGFKVEARQSNLLVESSQKVTRAELKKLLIERMKKSNKPYGLLIDDIEGGYTFTSRSMPNSFSILPTIVYKVYPDGREELVRGLNLIGTPLIAFSKISAADDEIGVFNGVCGARSGWVPVSAIAPGLLVDQIEVQRKEKADSRKPILPDPMDEAPANGAKEMQ